MVPNLELFFLQLLAYVFRFTAEQLEAMAQLGARNSQDDLRMILTNSSQLRLDSC